MGETDAILVLRSRRGDAAAFEELVRRHMRKAYLTALSQLGDVAAAEDVTQDALIAALERIEDCREPEHFAAWLIRIARNKAHNYRRRERVRSALPLEAADRLPAASDPLRDASRDELRKQLLSALDTLTERQREAVYLFEVEGLRHAEIAELLGLKEGNVRYHVFQARRALREKLGGVYGEG
ncbi:MAG: sigma-70 family RNA polymerase sigma factor [Gemmatimonadetes bacterium]|nr:sigma-70 family RNA polymerase sigma factor [Gemmatimonadota bacterium]